MRAQNPTKGHMYMSMCKMCFCMTPVWVCVWGGGGGICVHICYYSAQSEPAFFIVPFFPFEIQVYHFIGPLLQQWWPSKPAMQQLENTNPNPWHLLTNMYVACTCVHVCCVPMHTRVRWRVRLADYNDWANQACKRQCFACQVAQVSFDVQGLQQIDSSAI